MYELSIPIYNKNFVRAGREKTTALLHGMGVKRVFLALDRYETDTERLDSALESLK